MRAAAVLLTALFALATGAAAQPAPPVFALESPECAVTQDSRVDCLARDRTGAFVWMFHDGRRWSRPRRFAGHFAGPASCVVRGPQGMNCFAIRVDGTLWHAAMNGGAWRPWRPLGGRLAVGRPSCVAPARNQIACHARSMNGTLAIKAWLGDATWQEWRDAGGALSGDPSCVSLGGERVACFWRRADGSFSGLFPAEAGPGAAVLTLPRKTGTPNCAPLGAQRVLCLSRVEGGRSLEWRGAALLGGAGVDGFALRDTPMASDPVCTARGGRQYCVAMTPQGVLAATEVSAKGWSTPVALSEPGTLHSGRCYAFDQTRMGCVVLSLKGELRAIFREFNGPPGSGVSASAGPMLIEKPEPPAAAATPTPTLPVAVPVPAPVATVSVREPLGVWRVFEPRTGLHCQVTLFDAPAQPYRSLTRDADCAAMTSLSGVDRWSQSDGGIFLRDRRGRVYFRFMEAGPTALRARWRRNDFIMMARDLRAFASGPSTEPVVPPATAPSPGLAGVWRVRGPGRQSCRIRLSVDASTAATRAVPEDCRGLLAQADGWSVRRGALVLERRGAPIARFVEGRGITWSGRFENGRSGLRMVKQ